MYKTLMMVHAKAVVAFVTLIVTVASGDCSASTLTTLFTFDYAHGANPRSALTLSGSTLYGTTYQGGAHAYGTAFSMPVTGGTPTTLFSFDNATHGAGPNAGLTLSGSTLFGTTEYGGANGFSHGTVFSIPVSGGTPTTLFPFDDTHGNFPVAGLTLSGSTLYGTTYAGGAHNDGTVFSIPVTGGTPTTLFSFDGTHGANPSAELTLSGSTLYGTTLNGGANNDGTIFSIPVTGGSPPTTLFSFDGTHGANPYAGLTLSGSTLYGAAGNGGANNKGTVFSIPVSGGTPTVLYSFDGPHGANPSAELTLSGSTLYGTTYNGGANTDGTVFSIPVTGGTPTTLFDFDGAIHGAQPYAVLTLSGSTLYGTTYWGGANNDGTVFSLVVPEPSSFVLLSGAAAALACRFFWSGRRQRRS